MREIERKVDMESTGSGQPDEAQQQLMIERQLEHFQCRCIVDPGETLRQTGDGEIIC
jgi:hypothetical protein